MTSQQAAKIRWCAFFMAALVCALGLSACGGGGSESSADSSSPTVSSGSDKKDSEAKESSDPSGKSKEPSAEFAGKGENGVLATAGKESSVEERAVASEVVERNMRARAARNWAAQCQTLARSVTEQLEGASSGGFFKEDCAKALEFTAQKATPAALENTMIEPLAAFRVNGRRAFAFYHGAQGKDYVVPMELEGGEWKVASLVPQETP